MSYAPYPTDLNQPATDLLAYVEGKSCCKKRVARACYEIIGVAAGAVIGNDGGPDDPCVCPDDGGQTPCPCPPKEEQVAALKACQMKRGAIGDWLKTPTGQQVVQTALTVLMSLLATL